MLCFRCTRYYNVAVVLEREIPHISPLLLFLFPTPPNTEIDIWKVQAPNGICQFNAPLLQFSFFPIKYHELELNQKHQNQSVRLECFSIFLRICRIRSELPFSLLHTRPNLTQSDPFNFHLSFPPKLRLFFLSSHRRESVTSDPVETVRCHATIVPRYPPYRSRSS